jgi:hypothetical protein
VDMIVYLLDSNNCIDRCCFVSSLGDG